MHAAQALNLCSSRRMLILHGSGTSAGAFVNSDSAVGGKNFISGIPCRMDAGNRVPPNWQWEVLDAGSGDGSWWPEGADPTSGLDAAVAAVEVAMAATGAVGLIGHEQGATVAAVVAARSALGQGPPLEFAVACGACMPTGKYGELLQRLQGCF